MNKSTQGRNKSGVRDVCTSLKLRVIGIRARRRKTGTNTIIQLVYDIIWICKIRGRNIVTYLYIKVGRIQMIQYIETSGI